MTTAVVTVDRITPYKEIARLMTEHRISGLPVLMMGRHVAGVVTEGDLLAMEDKEVRRAHIDEGATRSRRWRGRKHPPWGLTAGELMSAPAITIHPDAPIPTAARVMHVNHVRRLPVVSQDGKLIGIVSRRDLLSVFLRPDTDIAQDVRELLDDILHQDPAGVTGSVRNGVVILTGMPGLPDDLELIPVVIRLIWDVDGVVDVINRLGEQPPASPGEAESQISRAAQAPPTAVAGEEPGEGGEPERLAAPGVSGGADGQEADASAPDA